jgi:hypothetical protein
MIRIMFESITCEVKGCEADAYCRLKTTSQAWDKPPSGQGLYCQKHATAVADGIEAHAKKNGSDVERGWVVTERASQ